MARRFMHTWVEDGEFRSKPGVYWHCPEHDVWFLMPDEMAALELHADLHHGGLR